MKKINEDKLVKLSTTNQMLNEKYGKHGEVDCNEFDERSLAWLYGYAERAKQGAEVDTKRNSREIRM